MKNNKQQLENIATVTRGEPVAVPLNKKPRTKDTLSGRIINPKGIDNLSAYVESLLKSIKESHAHMWGYCGEGRAYRRRPFSMGRFMGPQLSSVPLRPKAWAHRPYLRFQVHSVERAKSLNSRKILSHAERVALAECNLVACSEYCEALCSTYIDSVVGIDRNTIFSRPEGGTFGLN